MGQLSVTTRSRVAYYLIGRFHDTVRPWINHPGKFRKLLRQANSVLSGSIVLQYAMCLSWPSNNMDIYTPPGTPKWVVFQYLTVKERYTMDALWTDHRGPPHYFSEYRDDVLSVLQLTRTSVTPSKTITQVVKIVETTDPDPLNSLVSFNATWAMNWLSADAVGMAYPSDTLARRGTYCCIGTPEFTEAERKWLTSYRLRRFSQLTRHDLINRACGAFCPALRRFVGDNKCLKLTFGYPNKCFISADPAWWFHGGCGCEMPCWDYQCPRWGLTGDDMMEGLSV